MRPVVETCGQILSRGPWCSEVQDGVIDEWGLCLVLSRWPWQRHAGSFRSQGKLAVSHLIQILY